MKGLDVFVAVAVVAIVLLMIIPIPDFALDFFQLLNIALSMIVLLSSMYVRHALDMSSFPTLLLIITLFRLALNVASTRLILLEGEKFGGRVIRTFGEFVVKGDYIVGLVIFLILVIIQFIVITRGAERIAEVAARFTLDAMPGKQMSVDADLNAGLITEEEARKRRELIRREADFYGAMDGASKFVRGDAIASIIIVLVNIIGGILIGVLKHNLSFAQAAQVYALLTVGDGLVTQIPALLVSTATGILVSRAAAKENLGQDLVKELSSERKVITITGFILLFLGLATPLPITASIIGAAFLALAFYSSRVAPKQVAPAPAGAPAAPAPSKPILTTPQEIAEVIQSDTVEVEIGYGLIPLADPSQGGDLLERIAMVRKQIAYDLGLVVSPIRVRDSVLLKPNEYLIRIRGAEVARYELIPNRLLAINPGTATEKVTGIAVKEPAFGLQAFWIDSSRKEEATRLGYTVVDPPTVFITHLTETLKRNAADLLGSREFNMLLDGLREKFPQLVNDLIPSILKATDVKKILQRLLNEGVSIRNLPLIFETLLEYAEKSTDLVYLTEQVRRALKRQIVQSLTSEDGKLHAVALDGELEKRLVESLQDVAGEKRIVLNPQILREIMENLSKQLETLMKKRFFPLVVCSGAIRPYLAQLVKRFLPNVPVIAYEEVPEDRVLQVEGVVRL
ncbi:flagellar biosynthesis protein FlhA [Pseudothermotoga hypogea DSM 11164 = NBRC 106472]|uniref:Flagellar biosynthesis protein FlhA n=1 Tax=Pseudothermotoga hypogea DSM 11164 = NBRC 106472 TaxID=1123384 RepID=A0A0X1KNT9_9THEM|nr:flagellar biosynthesis protein FlhA [Pseudothermotoga hypogea]AJC72968.1 flagellar biosynthesis protein FlhA [Pseudothermotoga hypogea DSM 11164 = NBRC 106472]